MTTFGVVVPALQPGPAMKSYTLCLSLLIAPVAFAQPTGDTPPSSGSTSDADRGGSQGTPDAKLELSKADLQVMAHYHNLNQMEISLGKLAQKKSQSDDVKAYGAMLVKEHGDSDQQLVTLARRAGEKIPAVRPMNDVEKQELAMSKKNRKGLQKLTGTDFDRQYLRVMIADHEKELAKIDTKAAQVENAELADHVRAQKPILQMHADRARELQKSEAQAMR